MKRSANSISRIRNKKKLQKKRHKPNKKPESSAEREKVKNGEGEISGDLETVKFGSVS